MTTKEHILNLIQSQPDDVTIEEFMHQLDLERKLERGLNDERMGRTISHEEMRKRIDSWR